MLALLSGGVAGAQELAGMRCDAQRPALNFNRWNENWSALAEPCLPRQPLDGLKYLPLGDGGSYLSLGAGLRERYEHIATPLFGAGSARPDGYVIQRANVHADLRLGQYVQVFGQLVDARAFQKHTLAPPDQDKLDVEQLFATVAVPTDNGAVKLRVGRQEMAFDLQRFIAARDGPNVRQSFDGVWADWEHGPWRLIGYATQPVQNRSENTFDDYSNSHLRLDGLRAGIPGLGAGRCVGLLLALPARRGAFSRRGWQRAARCRSTCATTASAAPSTGISKACCSAARWAQRAQAWALGSIAGYTFASAPWTPRVGLQFDMASGDRHAGDGKLGTFNPLFANGYYFSLAGLTGYSNLIHLKPSLNFKPVKALSVTTSLGPAVAPDHRRRGLRAEHVGRAAHGRAGQPLDRRLRAIAQRLEHQSEPDGLARSGAFPGRRQLAHGGRRQCQLSGDGIEIRLVMVSFASR